ncbi:MAG TPA: hypothetical protein DET40_03280 [Lentisphaeria bacterium]|nr:MAG: hypothetical protein A2X45_22210 [Lentisphaerae bacterium GWF2_50_93]HCE42553.1 hypothetical protein [Lentisphaeria bacterium]
MVRSLPKKSVAKLPCSHKHMISTHALHVAGSSPGVKFVSVADRKFDDYFHFLALKGNGMDAVIRSCASRNVQVIRPSWLPEEDLTERQSGFRPALLFLSSSRMLSSSSRKLSQFITSFSFASGHVSVTTVLCMQSASISKNLRREI